MVREGAIIAAGAALAGAILLSNIGGSELATICEPGYAQAHRLPTADYYRIAHEAFRRDGIAWEDRQGYELDHVVTLCLGGSNNLDNLAPQPLGEARKKDRLEWRACQEVCAGRVRLDAARGWFADWRAAYKREFGETP